MQEFVQSESINIVTITWSIVLIVESYHMLSPTQPKSVLYNSIILFKPQQRPIFHNSLITITHLL